MPGALCPLSLQTIFDNGRPLVGAEIRIYMEGTLSPKTVYVDKALQVAHPHPILTNGQGRVPKIYIKGGDYRIRILMPAPHNEPIEDIDGIAGPIDLQVDVQSYPLLDANAVLKTGDALPSFNTGTRAGFARANGKSIGSAQSGATEVAVGVASNLTQPAGTAYNLFVFLWEKDASLPVYSGGTPVSRGSSAVSDWNNNRALALPDCRGLAMVGVDGMGNAASGQLTGAPFWKGDAVTVGSHLGAARHALTTGEIPSHAHTAASEFIPGHQHDVSITTTDAGGHSHTYAQSVSGPSSGGGSGSNHNTYKSPATSTSYGGNHTHGVNGKTNAGGGHSHAITVYSAGGGGSHNNVQPSGLFTLYIKL